MIHILGSYTHYKGLIVSKFEGALLFILGYHCLPIATIEGMIMGNLKFEPYSEVLHPL